MKKFQVPFRLEVVPDDSGCLICWFVNTKDTKDRKAITAISSKIAETYPKAYKAWNDMLTTLGKEMIETGILEAGGDLSKVKITVDEFDPHNMN